MGCRAGGLDLTLEERAAAVADLAMPGAVRGALRRARVYDKALKMLREATDEEWAEVQRSLDRKSGTKT